MNIEETPCPNCGEKKLRVEYRLEAKPIGTFSVAGSQPKVAARQWPWVVCDGCGVEARAKEDDA